MSVLTCPWRPIVLQHWIRIAYVSLVRWRVGVLYCWSVSLHVASVPHGRYLGAALDLIEPQAAAGSPEAHSANSPTPEASILARKRIAFLSLTAIAQPPCPGASPSADPGLLQTRSRAQEAISQPAHQHPSLPPSTTTLKNTFPEVLLIFTLAYSYIPLFYFN